MNPRFMCADASLVCKTIWNWSLDKLIDLLIPLALHLFFVGSEELKQKYVLAARPIKPSPDHSFLNRPEVLYTILNLLKYISKLKNKQKKNEKKKIERDIDRALKLI